MQSTFVREASHVRVAVGAVQTVYVPNEDDMSGPFYSESNLAYLRRAVTALDNGECVERDIIEVAE